MLAAQLERFKSDEAGATAIEYGLISALIAVALIASFSLLGNNVTNLFGYGVQGPGNVMAAATSSLP
ncbi:Flp family type IVb pilin [Devosia rhodophyticola]|uniref:Flp family type IVb pilin n=1 Tax=Devosia rhodophyticola TaxID=3026423 RepID=A0ABY7Z1U6_9HYPH|nr:Flp family type IVb pilin [Devosia rhodophyticola]WDR07516.1 Flp family type IVb pilin [Devosia rhodophyticola]